MKSIMHDKTDGTCYLCMMLHGDHSRKQTQGHHVFYGTANRKLSEKYGLKVYLCQEHHTYDGGPEAVHRNHDVDTRLKAAAQIDFETKYPTLCFRAVFGKSYMPF